jgi:hypothetical protein
MNSQISSPTEADNLTVKGTALTVDASMRASNLNSNPTVSFYAGFHDAYEQFNAALFESKLPPCLITMRSSNRVYGYHHAKRFVSVKGDLLDELGLHPGFFTLLPVEEVLATLVHEMVHHWQDHFGNPTRANAHNKEWSQKMKDLGLVPSSTALPGGRSTGRSMSHYIDPKGRFIEVCRGVVASGFRIEWFDRHAPRPESYSEQHQNKLKETGIVVDLSTPPVKELPTNIDGASLVYSPPPKREATRVRYLCQKCDVKAWAAPGTAIVCGNCNLVLVAASQSEPLPQ